MKHVIIAGPNQAIRAGERAYAVAFAKQLEKESGLQVHFLKSLQDAKSDALQKNQDKAQMGILPVSVEQYDEYVPFATPENRASVMEQFHQDDDVVIIGAGHSTLELTQSLQQQVIAAGVHSVTSSWMTHQVNNAWELAMLSENSITLATPKWISKDMLADMYPKAASHLPSVKMLGLEGVSSGNDRASLREDYVRFMLYNPVGQALVEKNMSYVAIIPNAGFDEKDGAGRSLPTLDEHYQQGRAVARTTAENVAFAMIDCGGRAIADEKYYLDLNGDDSETPFMAMKRGIEDARQEMGMKEAVILHDRFGAITPSGERTNGVNAMVYASNWNNHNCQKVFVNDEGEGTKFDFITLGSTFKAVVTPSSACENDPQRLASRQHFQAMGLTVMTPEELIAQNNLKEKSSHPQPDFYDFMRPEIVVLAENDLISATFSYKTTLIDHVNMHHSYDDYRVNQKVTFNAKGKPVEETYTYHDVHVFNQAALDMHDDVREQPASYTLTIREENGQRLIKDFAHVQEDLETNPYLKKMVQNTDFVKKAGLEHLFPVMS